MALEFSFQDIHFEGVDDPLDTWVVVEGVLRSSGGESLVSFRTRQNAAGNWRIDPGDLTGFLPAVPQRTLEDLLQKVIQRTKALLSPISAWPGRQSEAGGQLVLNEYRPPTDLDVEIVFSHRFEIEKIPAPPWSEMWSRIASRVRWDPHFRVPGLSRTDALGLLYQLEILFPVEWVENVYCAAMGVSASMSQHPPRSNANWFPASHLAKTATGALCADPAWVYLAEIAEAAIDLGHLHHGNRILRHARSGHGYRHHLCIAAELVRRSLLEALEPHDGSGDNDLRIVVSGRRYEVELKELTSASPVRKTRQLLARKSTLIPPAPVDPVVFHVVLADRDYDNRQREQDFYEHFRAGQIDIPENIVALVVSSCFVDSNGGRVKRDLVDVRIGASAAPEVELDLRTAFARNFESVMYPCFGFRRFVDTDRSTAAS